MNKKTKQIFNEILIIAVTFALAAFPFIAFGGTSGTIQLSGSISQVTGLLIESTSGATNLDLSSNTSNLKVAEVTEMNNALAGYTVTLSSLNIGKLKHATSDDYVEYTLKYNNSAVNLSETATVTDQGEQRKGVNIAKDVKISYTGQNTDEMAAGSYTDTLTLQIQAK